MIENRDPLSLIETHEGAVFVARRVRGNTRFNMSALLRAGSYHDTIPGEMHLLEHYLFHNMEGPLMGPGIAAHFEKMDGCINAYAERDRTVYHASVAKEHAAEALRTLGAMLCKPRFDSWGQYDEPLIGLGEWALTVNSQGFQKINNLPIMAALGADAPATYIGREDTLPLITAQVAQAAYERHYCADNLIVFVQGDAEPRHMLADAIRNFKLPRGPRNEILPPIVFSPSTVVVPRHAGEPGATESLFPGATVVEPARATRTQLVFPSHLSSAPPEAVEAEMHMQAMLGNMAGGLHRHGRFGGPHIYGFRTHGWHDTRFGYTAVEFDAARPAQVAEASGLILREVDRLASDPDTGLFHRIRKNRLARMPSDPAALDVAEKISQIFSTGINYPSDASRAALTNLTPDKFAGHAQRFAASGPVSVVHEGALTSALPDHKALAQMRIGAGERTPAMNKNLMAGTARPVVEPD